jgi:hypothetical protein
VCAIEAHADFLAHQVWPECVTKGPLNDEHIGSVQSRWCELSVCSFVDASSVDNLAYQKGD